MCASSPSPSFPPPEVSLQSGVFPAEVPRSSAGCHGQRSLGVQSPVPSSVISMGKFDSQFLSLRAWSAQSPFPPPDVPRSSAGTCREEWGPDLRAGGQDSHSLSLLGDILYSPESPHQSDRGVLDGGQSAGLQNPNTGPASPSDTIGNAHATN